MTSEELLSCLVDRPCSACKFHTENGCSKWNCVFEEQHENTEENPCALCPHSECEDAISRQAVMALAKEECETAIISYKRFVKGINALPSVQPKTAWIPIKTRPLTEEEHQYFDGYGESAYNCPLPDDGQEVLVTSRYGYVTTDTFCRDDGCYFETYCDDGDVLAWMPKPTPYKAESEETNAKQS